MNHLHRDLAPISETGWDAIDDEAKSRLTTYLAARKLVDFAGPHGWEHSATDLGRIADDLGAVRGRRSGRSAGCCPWSSCGPSSASRASQLDDADRGATDIDLAELDEAVRQIAIGENVAVFHGYRAGGIRGITESTSHAPIVLRTRTWRNTRTPWPQAVDALRQSGIDGPYGMAICPRSTRRSSRPPSTAGTCSSTTCTRFWVVRLVWAPGVDGGVVLSLRGGDFVLDSGQDLSIGYLDHDADAVRLYLEESFSFRVVEPDAAVACPRAEPADPGGRPSEELPADLAVAMPAALRRAAIAQPGTLAVEGVEGDGQGVLVRFAGHWAARRPDGPVRRLGGEVPCRLAELERPHIEAVGRHGLVVASRLRLPTHARNGGRVGSDRSEPAGGSDDDVVVEGVEGVGGSGVDAVDGT